MSTSPYATTRVVPSGRAADSSRRWAVLLNPRAQVALAFAVYLALALIVTWPWVLHPGSRLFGVIGGDLTSNIGPFQQYANALHPPFLPGTIPEFNAPEGLPVEWTVYLAAFGSSSVLWVLSVAFGAVAAHGLVAVSGFALSAFAMFLLVRWATGHAGVGFAIGLAYGFWPYMYGTGWTWPHYIHIWVFVLVVWRMLVVADRPTARNGLWAGLAAVVALTWIQYNLLIGAVLVATLSAVALVRSAAQRRLGAQIQAQAIAVGIPAIVSGAILIAAARNGYSGVPIRPERDAIAGSARPLMYVVPGPRHPLFGSLTKDWIARHFAGPMGHPPTPATYAQIYLGIPLIGLALVGALWTLRRAWRRGAQLSDNRTLTGLTALILGAVAFAFAAPPEVRLFGHTVPMPYHLVNQFTTVFRVAHRFAVLVMLAVCLLAGLALARLLEGRARRVQWVVLAVVTVVFAIDLYAPPHPRTTPTAVDIIYRKLALQPPGIVAEYPLAPPAVSQNLQALRPDMPQHPSFTGYELASAAGSRKQELAFLDAPRTIPELAAYGVSYVIVDGAAMPSRTLRGLTPLAATDRARLYRVTARPPRFITYADPGFNITEGNSPGVRWMGKNGAKLNLWGACRPCDGTLAFQAGTFATPRTLTITDPAGNVLLRDVIGGAGQPVSLHVRFTETTSLTFRTDPPPIEVNRVLGGDDTRKFAIYVGQPVRFAADAANQWTGQTVRFASTSPTGQTASFPGLTR